MKEVFLQRFEATFGTACGQRLRNMVDGGTLYQQALVALSDSQYRAFHSRLMPTVPPEKVLGVRTPVLRKFAKMIRDLPDTSSFLQSLPHRYYEENNLHGFLIELLGEYPPTIRMLEQFLPYVDNWATCDMMRPSVFRRHLPELLPRIYDWTQSDGEYTVRYGIEMLMCFYLEEAFSPTYPERVAAVSHEGYYVRMMVAWYFATALAKQYDAVLPYLTQGRLPVWTHNKTIQKALESNRITPAQKDFLRTLKIQTK